MYSGDLSNALLLRYLLWTSTCSLWSCQSCTGIIRGGIGLPIASCAIGAMVGGPWPARPGILRGLSPGAPGPSAPGAIVSRGFIPGGLESAPWEAGTGLLWIIERRRPRCHIVSDGIPGIGGWGGWPIRSSHHLLAHLHLLLRLHELRLQLIKLFNLLLGNTTHLDVLTLCFTNINLDLIVDLVDAANLHDLKALRWVNKAHLHQVHDKGLLSRLTGRYRWP